MTLQIEIHEQACRGCQICVDLCPTDVLEYDAEAAKARVRTVEDCIACLSCAYACPSGAILHTGYYGVKNFYRDLTFLRRMDRFL